jgi:hypothetical protein
MDNSDERPKYSRSKIWIVTSCFLAFEASAYVLWIDQSIRNVKTLSIQTSYAEGINMSWTLSGWEVQS